MPAANHAPSNLGPARPEPVGGRSDDVSERLAEVRRRIGDAAERAGREPREVTVVAVSKTFGVEAVAAVRAAGQIDFGEARAQELKTKARQLDSGIRWHFVGRLQRNKVKDVVGRAALIHVVDRPELARAVAERARRQSVVAQVLVQVNVGEDPAKGGCSLRDAPGLLADVAGRPGIDCRGLMTIPPLGTDPRPCYRRLRELRDELRERFPEVVHLSMGMTGDFETAVEEGATIVRVGEAIFGRRPDPGR